MVAADAVASSGTINVARTNPSLKPAHSPEVNPAEACWRQLKEALGN